MNSFVISMSTFNNGFLKIPVLILPFIICWFVWHKRTEKGFLWLIISMLSFAIGEAACGINVWILIKLVPIFEILHGLGMMLGFCAFVLAVYFIAEEYFLYYSDDNKNCLFFRFCKGSCPKLKKPVKGFTQKCKVKTLFIIAAFCLALLSFMPLGVEKLPREQFMNPEKYENIHIPVLTSFYENFWKSRSEFFTYELWKSFDHNRFPPIELFEKYIYSILAICMFLLSGFILLIKKVHPERIAIYFYSIAIGSFSYSFMRTNIINHYESVYAGMWEEVTELMFVAATLLILFLFKRELKIEPKK